MDRAAFKKRKGVTIDGETLGAVSSETLVAGAQLSREPTPEAVKAQGTRLADIFVYGPLMLYAGLGKDPPKWVRIGMLLIGAGTIVYQLVNFMAESKRAGGLSGLAGMAVGPVDRARAEALQRLIKTTGKP